MFIKSRWKLILLLAVVIVLSGLQWTSLAGQNVENGVSVNLSCGISLEIPSEYAQIVVHNQKKHFSPVSEVFSMQVGEEEIPLYRIDFGNESFGEWLGVIQTEEGDIPVTFMVYPLSAEELEVLDEETVLTYYGAMENLNLVLDAICMDPRFVQEIPDGIGEYRELELEHWMLDLPSKVSCVESNENGVYSASFFGRICGEDVPLYTVNIGDEDDAIGVYNLNGEERPLSVDVYEVGKNAFWSEEDYEAAYRMLDTINDVMDVILSSEDYRG